MNDTMQEESIDQCRPISPWALALCRAEQNARLYFSQWSERWAEEKRRLHRMKHFESFVGQKEHHNLLKSLTSSYNVTTTYAQPGQGPFEELRWKFFKEHSRTFCEGLVQCLGGAVHICPTPLSANVGEKFRLACNGGRRGTLVPAFHGTHENSLSGIYTASMANPALSRGYARGQNPPVLVCGVLDPMNEEPSSRPAPMLPRPRRIASLQPPTPLRRGPAKQARRAQFGPPNGPLVGAPGFLTRRAARRRFGPLDLRSTTAAQLAR